MKAGLMSKFVGGVFSTAHIFILGVNVFYIYALTPGIIRPGDYSRLLHLELVKPLPSLSRTEEKNSSP